MLQTCDQQLIRIELMKSRKKIALALQGGGTHGTFTWGVLDYLLEDGRFEIEGLSGTSAGGMNAAAVTQGLVKGGDQGGRQELRRFWELVHKRSAFSSAQPTQFTRMLGYSLRLTPAYSWGQWAKNFFSPYEFNPLNVNPLRDLVTEFFDFDLLRQAKNPKLFLCATHVKSGKLKIFKGRQLKLESLLASACLPTLFQAVEVDGEHYWDGGFIGNPALFPLIYNCASKDFIVIQVRQAYRDKLPTTAQEIIDRQEEITYNACLIREMRSTHYISKMVDKGIIIDKGVKSLNMHVIRNAEVFGQLDQSSALNADWDFFEYLFNAGRDTTQKWVAKHFNDIGVRTTANLDEDFIK